ERRGRRPAPPLPPRPTRHSLQCSEPCMRILLVEDSKRLARSIQTGLRKLGHGVDLVHEGPRGLSYARHNPYELLILDILLPGIDGLSVLRELRGEGAATP